MDPVDGRYLVLRHRLPDTDAYRVEVWEPLAGQGTQTHIDGRWWGKPSTAPLPPEIDALPAFSRERADAYHLWHADQRETERHAVSRAGFSPAEWCPDICRVVSYGGICPLCLEVASTSVTGARQ